MVANVITYRPKSAIRDAARAFGFRKGAGGAVVQGAGSSAPDSVLEVAQTLQKMPRHMGIHPGGMVLTRTPVSQVCPVRWGGNGRTHRPAVG